MFGTDGVHLPSTDEEFYLWAFLLIVLYVVLASAVQFARGKYELDIAASVFNAVTFSGSILLLIGVIIDPQVLKLMGNTTWFLIVAGTFGIIYTIHVMFRR